MNDPLARFAAPVGEWFRSALGTPTQVQAQGWAALGGGRSALLLAPTGSGKTLAAFLAALDRLMFAPREAPGVRLLYVSPLKALGVDVERNLRAPIAGIRAAAERMGVRFSVPSTTLRSGDTPARERAQFRKAPSDILITTPESLYLLLTSQAAEHLRQVEAVIVDEIHALLGTKRGAHLALSLERLERLRATAEPLQRIGLSATVRPVEEAAAFLGGATPLADGTLEPRPVTIVDTSGPPRLALRVAVPVEDMAKNARESPDRSIWPALHGPLVELIRAHRSTLLFVNSRRLAERLSASLNELAGEPLAFAHHGSVAKDRRAELEDALKLGRLRALVATSSLELGIDMGAIDLVVQIEAPPSVSAGLQRVGRAGHSVGGVSSGIIFPKFRGDLLAAAATAQRMREGAVEAIAFPRNPLDVLAQQIVASVSDGEIGEDELYVMLRSAAPFRGLPRPAFEAVLDLLSGRYPSDEFAELKPRLVWDRIGHRLSARQGARSVAVINGGTIPDRGLFGVFLAGTESGKSVRVGELDEEMVFESRVGDVFLLGASSWRIEDITLDRVLVTPAPGEPGKMPFWHGDRPGRPLELGRAIGRASRELLALERDQAEKRLTLQGLDERAASNLLDYLAEQRAATGEVPSDRQLVVEQFRDEVGDWRVCLLSPFGARVHAPWGLAAMALQREALGVETEAVWSDDGIVFRFPEGSPPTDLDLLLPPLDTLDELLQQSLSASSLFAARFRENSARALLLPRRRPGQRAPLWAQRRRSADLLRAASKYPQFPILLETFRECLRDVFDVPGLRQVLEQVQRREVRLSRVETRTASPFAASLLFSYVGNFMYEADAPLAERRAQALTIDPTQLAALLGEAELRSLLDPDAIAEVERDVQRQKRPLEHADALHDLLIAIGDQTREQLESRAADPAKLAGWLEALAGARRVIVVPIAGEVRYAAAEDASRLRDALGVVLPRGLPSALLAAVADPLGDLVSRHARSHGPFTLAQLQARYGLAREALSATLDRLTEGGRLVRGAFLAGGHDREWCDAEVLRRIKQKSLIKLRREVEPVAPEVYARLSIEWQGAAAARGGPDALPSALEQLEGYPLVASSLERQVLPARVRGYQPGELDALTGTGEFVWRGLEPLGNSDGRIAFYRADRFARLAPPVTPVAGDLAEAVRGHLRQGGASFFAELVARTRAFPPELLETLWSMVFAGEVTNDTLAPVRSRIDGAKAKERPGRARLLRTRAHLPPGSEGRWSLLERWLAGPPPNAAESAAARVEVLLERYGVLPREAILGDALGSFAELYPVLKALEESGRVRRGYFVAGLGAAQFARAGADDRLRALRNAEADGRAVVLAATDPANPYGAALPWPEGPERPQRAAGALVLLAEGALLGYLARGEKSLLTFLPEREPERGHAARRLAQALAELVDGTERRAIVLASIDGSRARSSTLGAALEQAGFTPIGDGYVLRQARAMPEGRRARG
ncbi:MAG TPA: DEAD/DEAH box helicase [Polyangiaceae bacterium]|nr:DEAD/DEAH box helicase [Polyangiaceae bacterium]